MLYVCGNNCDTDDAEYYVNHLMVAVLRELHGDTLLYYRSKPHHDGSVMWDVTGGTVSEKYKIGFRLDSPEGLYFYVTSFWTSKLFRTLVRRTCAIISFPSL